MEISKEHATLWLALEVGRADGGLSEEEVRAANLSQVFRDAVDVYDEYKALVASGTMHTTAAINTLKDLTHQDRLDAMVACLLIAAADGVLSEGESEAIARFSVRLEIEIEELMAAWKQTLSA